MASRGTIGTDDRAQLAVLLARDRERDAPADMTIQRQQTGASDIGILSRTIIPSSMTKWIIPTRFASSGNVHLLFVGENYIHIKEVVPDKNIDFRLRQRQSISFIESPIRAVKILDKSNVTRSNEEDGKIPSLSEILKSQSTEAGKPRTPFPIQIIVVTVGSGWMHLITPDLTPKATTEYMQFNTKRVALPCQESRPTSPGAKIAVDPFSRALAVAAGFDTIVIYNCHDSMVLSTRLATDPENWNPISQERIMTISGCIVGLEFLNPGRDGHPDDVVLIIITATKGRNRMICLTWRHQDGPFSLKMALEDVPFTAGNSDSSSLCNMIIPMAHAPDFILIHGDTFNLYTKILTGRPSMHNIANKQSNWDAEPTYPANSKRRPQFTAWARPSRVPGHTEEFVFFMREDGVLRHYLRHSKRTVEVGEVGNSGLLNCHTDTAFAAFMPHPSLPDYVITGGDMSQGEFHSVGVNLLRTPEVAGGKHDLMGLLKLRSLHDWAPIVDLQIHAPDQGQGRPNLMVTNGRQPFGAVSELRFGHELEINTILDFGDESLLGANGMWVLRDEASGSAHIICSYPGQSVAISVQEEDWADGASNLRIDNEEETIYAIVNTMKQTDCGALIVIVATPSAITLQQFDSEQFYEKRWEGTIVAACACSDMLVLAFREQDLESHVCMFQIRNSPLELHARDQGITIDEEVTALHLYSKNLHKYLVVATRDGIVRLYGLHDDSNQGIIPEPVACLQLGGTAIQSISILSSESGSIIFCGTRDGKLWIVEVRTEVRTGRHDDAVDINGADRALQVANQQCYRIGNSSVHLSAAAADGSVFLLCDHETLFIRTTADVELVQFERCIMTSTDNVSYRSTPLVAIVGIALPGLRDTNAHRGSTMTDSKLTDEYRLVCHDGSNIILATMYHEAKVLPRRLPLKKMRSSSDSDPALKDIAGTPTKLLYSRTLAATIVAGMKYEHRPNRKVPEPSWQGKRVSRGFLTVLHAEANKGFSPGEIAWNNEATNVDFAPSERVLCACEWNLEHKKSKHRYLVVGTSIRTGEMKMIDGRRRLVQHGRLWFLIPRKDKDTGVINLDLQYIKRFDNRPVRALAVLEQDKLVVAPDEEVRVYAFKQDKKFSQVCKTILPSPATYITTEGRHIVVTMLSHSISGYEYKEGSEGMKLEQHFTDNMMRKGSTHMPLSLRQPLNNTMSATSTATSSSRSHRDTTFNVILGADKNSQVFGIDVPNVRRHQTSSTTVFELRLPQCVTKFARGAIRSPWQERGSPVIGVLGDDTVGVATDGTIYHFTILTNEARLLLKFLENLIRWSERQDQVKAATREREFARADEDVDYEMLDAGDADDVVDWNGQDIIIDPEYVPGAAGNRLRRDQYGINGDFLMPLLQREGPGVKKDHRLRQMLMRSETWTRAMQDRSTTSAHTGNGNKQRWQKFEELARRNFADERKSLAGWTERCITWLEEILRPVL